MFSFTRTIRVKIDWDVGEPTIPTSGDCAAAAGAIPLRREI